MPERTSTIVEKTYRSAATPQAVFAVLTDQEAIAACCQPLERVRIDAKSGGRVQFTDPEFGRVIGRIGEFEPGLRLSYRFVQNWPSVLTFDFFADGEGTRIDVIHSGFAGLRQGRPDLDLTFAERWDAWMAGLLERVEANVAPTRA